LRVLAKRILTYCVFDFGVVGVLDFGGDMLAISDASIDVIGEILVIELFADIHDVCGALLEIGPFLLGFGGDLGLFLGLRDFFVEVLADVVDSLCEVIT
jgi:hypothetical protein